MTGHESQVGQRIRQVDDLDGGGRDQPRGSAWRAVLGHTSSGAFGAARGRVDRAWRLSDRS
jgi:hypothetical protein